MRLRRASSGEEIDAAFELRLAGSSDVFALTIESAGGVGGAGKVRNPEYSLLLEEVLRRLSRFDVVLVDALVDSRRVSGLPSASRTLRLVAMGRPASRSTAMESS